MNRIKAFLIVVFLPFILSGCFGGGEEVVLDEYQGENFTIGVINEWTRLTKQEFNDRIPNEAIAAFMSSDPTINITIVREFLSDEATSIEYSDANIVNAERTVLDYEKITIDEAVVSELDTKVHTFRGKGSPSDLLLKFVQTYVVKDKTGYTITGTLYPDATEEEVTAMKNMVLSFAFKGTETEESE